jgi:hypothetical protein
MDESKRDEHRHLQERTDQLKEEHAGLGLDRTPFNQADHDLHQARLRKLKDDLARHKLRPDDPQQKPTPPSNLTIDAPRGTSRSR